MVIIMYVEKYINDFDEKIYSDFLAEPNKLEQLANAYISQYSNPTYDCTIAFKESLDHYIVKQCISNPLFSNTNEFRNYAIYLNGIFSKRVSVGNFQLEYNTNILFQNEQLKNVFLSFYDKNTRNKLESIISDNERIIDNIFVKMEKAESLSQLELNLISDYLYTRRNFNDERYPKFIEYILNNDNKNISNSPQIIAAYIAYLPKIYGDGCEYSRAILSNGIARSSDLESVILPSEIDKYRGMKKLRSWGFYSRSDKYISMGWDFLRDLNLTSDLSLNISRTMAGNGSYKTEEEREEAKKYNDLYWLSMTTFHEMTHQLQNNAMKSSNINSSGLSQLIKIAKRNANDNSVNHDSIESEIEADEVSWEKMYSLIMKYRLNRKFLYTDKKENQLKKCLINKETVYARRAIRTKFKSNERFFASDIKEIQARLNDSVNGKNYRIYFQNILKNYPMFNKIFDESGNVKTTIMFDSNLTSKNKTGNDENITSCELSNYILEEGYNTLKFHLLNDSLSKEQITNLMMNIYNTYHLQKKYINSLSKLDFSQLNETHTNFDYNNIKDKYLEKFKNVANLVYKERELVTIINKKYPEYNIEQISDPKYAFWNYQDMFNHLFSISNGNIDYNSIKDILDKYESSNDPILVGLASETKKNIVLLDENLDSGFKY